MESDQQHAQGQAIQPKTLDAGTKATVGATNSSAQLAAPQQPVASSLGNEVDRARMLLAAAGNDVTRRLDAVKRILDAAVQTSTDEAVATQLFAVVAAIQDPQIQQLVQDARRHRPPPPVSWKDKEFVANDHRNPSFKGVQKSFETKLTKKDLYDAITRVAPDLPHALKVCMVGQVWTEQGGKGVFNFNFAGVEGPGVAYVNDIWTSTAISVRKYNETPEPRSATYRDWTPGNPHGGVWGLPGHPETPRGTIQFQLDNHEDPIIVMTKRERPAYESVDQGAAAFVKMFEYRVRTLQRSGNPAHRKLADDALNGDPKAYATLINMPDTNDRDAQGKPILDDQGKPMAFGAWNGSGGYTQRAIKSINQTATELAPTPITITGGETH